jgi:hypothetical protein
VHAVLTGCACCALLISRAGAVNAANEKVNAVANALTGEEDAVPATARYYKSKGLPWVVIGEALLQLCCVACGMQCCCCEQRRAMQGSLAGRFVFAWQHLQVPAWILVG